MGISNYADPTGAVDRAESIQRGLRLISMFGDRGIADITAAVLAKGNSIAPSIAAARIDAKNYSREVPISPFAPMDVLQGEDFVHFHDTILTVIMYAFNTDYDVDRWRDILITSWGITGSAATAAAKRIDTKDDIAISEAWGDVKDWMTEVWGGTFHMSSGQDIDSNDWDVLGEFLRAGQEISKIRKDMRLGYASVKWFGSGRLGAKAAKKLAVDQPEQKDPMESGDPANADASGLRKIFDALAAMKLPLQSSLTGDPGNWMGEMAIAKARARSTNASFLKHSMRDAAQTSPMSDSGRGFKRFVKGALPIAAGLTGGGLLGVLAGKAIAKRLNKNRFQTGDPALNAGLIQVYDGNSPTIAGPFGDPSPEEGGLFSGRAARMKARARRRRGISEARQERRLARAANKRSRRQYKKAKANDFGVEDDYISPEDHEARTANIMARAGSTEAPEYDNGDDQGFDEPQDGSDIGFEIGDFIQ